MFAAHECDINLKTSFLWRHRFLRYALTTSAKNYAIVEADEVLSPNRLRVPVIWNEQRENTVAVDMARSPTGSGLIALDRYENETETVLFDKKNQQIAPALQPLISRGSVLCPMETKVIFRSQKMQVLFISD